jgi:ATP-dependent exoDNAse (exonuclease V) beta subunit
MNNILSERNNHLRDINIQFIENTHTYIIQTDRLNKYTSVTTWIHSMFYQFDTDKTINHIMTSKSWREGHKYWGKTVDEIKELWKINSLCSSQQGTRLHFLIECFMNNHIFERSYIYSNKDLFKKYINEEPPTHNDIEWTYFIDFIKSYPQLIPYRTEWTIYHEDIKIAGSIDMIFKNSDETFSIYDWKRCKTITKENYYNKYSCNKAISYLPDTNYWHYALQLNIYKYILEEKYQLKIKDLILVQLHPENTKHTYELHTLPDLSNEVRLLIENLKKQSSLILVK